MVRAYATVTAAVRTPDRIVPAARALDGATDTHAVAEAEADGVADLRGLAASSIRGLDGVGPTRTYTVAERE